MTQQTWGAPPQQQFPQQGYAPVQQPGGYAQPQQQAPWGGQPQQQAPTAPAVAPVSGEEFDDFFSGGVKGAPGFDFGATQNGGEKAVGSQVIGEIVEMVKMQQIDFGTKKPLFFENGDPRMQVAITLQTELRGWQGVKPKLIPVDDATGQPKAPQLDDGKRRIYVKGDMVRAINVACAKAGQKPRIGGKLAVVVKGFEDVGKGNPKTLYDAQYLPAPEKVATDSFFDAGQQQAPQQFAQAPVQQQAAPPVQMPAYGGPGDAAPQFPPPQQAQQAAPQQYPSTLGNNPAPAGPPEWAAPAQQGYAPPAPAQQQAPVPAGPAGFEAPPF